MASEASNPRNILAQDVVTANGSLQPHAHQGRLHQGYRSHQHIFRSIISRAPWLAVLLSIASLIFSGCGGSTHPTIAAISFANGTVTSVAPGAVTALSAVVTNDSENLGVDWSVTCTPPTGSTIANACGSFAPAHTASGAYTNFTAPDAIPTNTNVMITATSTTDPTRTSTLQLSIAGPSLTVSVSPATANVEVNGQAPFTATVANDPANGGVNWTLTCGTSVGAVCGSLSANQSPSGTAVTYTGPAADPGSPVTLTATSVTNPTISGSATITVVPAITVAFLTLPPATIAPGSSVALTALVSNDYASGGVTWTATAGTFSATQTASGVATTYTAPAATAGTVVAITAASVTDPTKTVSANLTIEYNISVAISSAITTLPAGGTASFTATVINDGANGGVNWSASSGTFTPVHTAGGVATTYTAPSSIPTAGTVTITATSATDPTKSASATVTITAAAISVAIAPLTTTVQVGTAAGFVAVVTNDPNSRGVTWSTTGGTIAPAQTASGAATIFTAPSTVPSGGTVTITATSVADPTKSATATVTISVTAPPISIVISPSSTTVAPSGTQDFTATVSNDNSNGGVNWTTTGGTLVPTQTASGVATVFTAPSTIPTGGTVTITATSVTDPTKSATVMVTIAQPSNNGVLNGQYAFSMTGGARGGGQLNSAYESYLGSINADGNGNIKAWEVDYASGASAANVTGTTGTYSLDASGHGTVVLTNSGASFSLTISISMVSPSHGLVASAENDSAESGVLGGSIDLQNTSEFSTPLNGSYALTFGVIDSGLSYPDLLGGTLTITNGTITTYYLDENYGGATSPSAVSATDTLGVLDGNGRGVFTPSSLGKFSGLQFVYYVVDSTHFLIGTGSSSGAGGLGIAYLEPATPLASLAGTYVFTETAYPVANLTSEVDAGGVFTCDANGNLTSGTLDVNNTGTFTTGAITGTCALDSPADGRGVITITSGESGDVSTFAVYPTANNTLLMLDLDSTVAGNGVGYTQAGGVSASTFSGNYAASFIDYYSNSSVYSTLLGDITASGTTALSGTVDINDTSEGEATQGAALTGSGSLTDTGSGRLTGEFTTSPTTTQSTVYDLTNVFYIVDANTLLTLESDSVPGTGILQMQNLSVTPNLRPSKTKAAKHSGSTQPKNIGESVKENR